MTNRIAIILAIVLMALLGGDWLYNDSAAVIFLGRKLIVLIEYIAFWR
ncbi:hypothetical protein ACROSR_06705 [Roseovarius tibetensis]